MTDLFAKYDVPAPRYTSYPTVPFWTDSPTTDRWLEELNKSFADEAATWSLYFHLPFCESLCTFCACNTVITRDHGREDGYVELLSTEWNLYLDRVPGLAERPLLGVHLGGGTPTFFAKENLSRILSPILAKNVGVPPPRCTPSRGFSANPGTRSRYRFHSVESSST